MTTRHSKSWFRPRFTIGALLLLMAVCAPFLAYLSVIRRWNDQRQAAHQEVIAKGIHLGGDNQSPPATSPKDKSSSARKFWAAIVGNPELPNFTRVQIHDFFGKNRPRPPITDRDLQQLEYLPEIEEITFYYSRDITDEGLAVLGKLPKLRRIQLQDMALIRGDFLDHLPDNCPLESLWFDDLKGLEGEKLKSLKRFKNLQKISIGICPLLSDATLADVDLPPSLRELTLFRTAIGDQTLSRWLSQIQFERLSINAAITRGIVPVLSKQTKLDQLEITNAPLLDEDLAFLKNCPRLGGLKLNAMPIRGDVLDHIATPQKLGSLELNNTLINDQNLSKMAQFPKLKHLGLAWTPLTGEGFAAEVNWPMPWSIALSGTHFSDAGKKAFAKMKGLKSVMLPGNWSPEDNRRFPAETTPSNATLNGIFSKNRGAGVIDFRCHLPAIKLEKIDNCPADLMKPVADLQAIGLAEDAAFRAEDKDKP